MRGTKGVKSQEVKIPKTTLGDEDKSLRAWLPKEDNEPSVLGKNPHKYNFKLEVQ